MSCRKCGGRVSFASHYGQTSEDVMTWHCKDCGYVETGAMRRRRRLLRKLLALLILFVACFAAAYAIGLVWSRMAARFTEEYRARLIENLTEGAAQTLSVLLVFAGALAFVSGVAWAVFQFRRGWWRQTRDDLCGVQSRDRKERGRRSL